jgi:hypothetical protein
MGEWELQWTDCYWWIDSDLIAIGIAYNYK